MPSFTPKQNNNKPYFLRGVQITQRLDHLKATYLSLFPKETEMWLSRMKFLFLWTGSWTEAPDIKGGSDMCYWVIQKA
jgi:hypothetical protein